MLTNLPFYKLHSSHLVSGLVSMIIEFQPRNLSQAILAVSKGAFSGLDIFRRFDSSFELKNFKLRAFKLRTSKIASGFKLKLFLIFEVS